MREINGHQINECNKAITITADEPDAEYGNASHNYTVTVMSGKADGLAHLVQIRKLAFQRGPIKEVGTNGITHEVLLAILIDRLQGFQSGPFACTENASALAHLEAARDALHARTKARVARGVEGTNVA